MYLDYKDNSDLYAVLVLIAQANGVDITPLPNGVCLLPIPDPQFTVEEKKSNEDLYAVLLLILQALEGGGGATYTFSNGLTETAGAVKLGGVMTESIDIEYHGNDDPYYFLNIANDLNITGTYNVQTTEYSHLLCYGETTSSNITLNNDGYIVSVHDISNSNLYINGVSVELRSNDVYFIINNSDRTASIGSTAPIDFNVFASTTRITSSSVILNGIPSSTPALYSMLVLNQSTGAVHKIPAISYTFSNGLTETAGAVKLGGSLTQNTEILGAGNGFSVKSDNTTVFSRMSVNGSEASLYRNITGGGNATLGATDTGYQFNVTDALGRTTALISNFGNNIYSDIASLYLNRNDGNAHDYTNYYGDLVFTPKPKGTLNRQYDAITSTYSASLSYWNDADAENFGYDLFLSDQSGLKDYRVLTERNRPFLQESYPIFQTINPQNAWNINTTHVFTMPLPRGNVRKFLFALMQTIQSDTSFSFGFAIYDRQTLQRLGQVFGDTGTLGKNSGLKEITNFNDSIYLENSDYYYIAFWNNRTAGGGVFYLPYQENLNPISTAGTITFSTVTPFPTTLGTVTPDAKVMFCALGA